MTDQDPLVYWGRVRTGHRGFWTARRIDVDGIAEQVHGWTDTLEAAARQGHLAALKLAGGRCSRIFVRHGAAGDQLKRINAEKRAAAKPKTKTGPEDITPVGWLYAIDPGHFDGDDRWTEPEIIRFPIVRITAKRIFYLRCPESLTWRYRDDGLGYIDRQRFEQDGQVAVLIAGQCVILQATPPTLPERPPARPRADDRLKALKAAMRAAHPDLGGSDAEFIAARARYERARARA